MLAGRVSSPGLGLPRGEMRSGQKSVGSPCHCPPQWESDCGPCRERGKEEVEDSEG